MRGWKYLFAFMVLSSVSAQGATNGFAFASTAETNVFLGQVFNVDVIVKAPGKPHAPTLDDLADFNAILLEDGRETSETDTWLYRFAFRARREGVLSIPSMRFGGVATEPVLIRAQKPEQTDHMILKQTLSAQSVYVGQPVLLTTVWDSAFPFTDIKAVDFYFPALTDKRFEVLDLYEPEKEQESQTTGLPVHGTRVLATRNSYRVDEVQHQSLSFSKILIPQKTGKIMIPPATLLCAVEKAMDGKTKQSQRTSFQYPPYFDNTFFDQNVTDGNYARIYAESKPLELEVRPLPVAGRSSLFSGLVGEYSIAVTAEPKTVRVGDPVTLTITVTSSDIMENIVLPPLRYQPLLVNRFDVPSDRTLPERKGKSKIYTQTIRPRSTAVTNVPPLELSFFSPASNAYLTVHSEPIPLKVSTAEAIAIYADDDTPEYLQMEAEGLCGSDADRAVSDSAPGGVFDFARRLLLPLLVLFAGGIWLVSRWVEKGYLCVRRPANAARAGRVFRRNVAQLVRDQQTKREIYKKLDFLLRVYLGTRLLLNPGTLTFREVEARLIDSGVDHQVFDDLRDLFMRCEAYRFTQGFDGPADSSRILDDVRRVIRGIEKIR